VTLSDCKEGQWLQVTGTEGEEMTIQSLRFGLGDGAKIQVQKNIKGGPVIISKNQLEIAIGRKLADCIQVRINDKPAKAERADANVQ
jgi:Fe2+ transport system protein FeoA